MKTVITSVLILFMVTACATPELTKRYAKADFDRLQTEEAKKYVTINGFAYSIATKPSQNKILDFTDRGQQAFITALAEKEKDTDKFLLKLIKPLEGEQSQNVIDQTKFSRKLVLSIENKTNSRANRIDSIKLTLTLKEPDKVKFSSWDKIVTNYQYIDIGKLTMGRTTSFVFSPEVTTPYGSGKIGSMSYEKSVQEEVNIKDRSVTSGTLTDNIAILFQKGVPGIDLSGNLIADVEFQVTDIAVKTLYKFDDLFKKDGSPETDHKNINIVKTLLSYPNLQKDIEGNLEYEFVFRDVKRGEETYTESDDDVVFQKGEGERGSITLIKQDDYRMKTWKIIFKEKNSLHILFKGRKTATLIEFASYNDADTFLKWLIALKTHTIKENKIRIGPKRAITDADFANLEDLTVEVN